MRVLWIGSISPHLCLTQRDAQQYVQMCVCFKENEIQLGGKNNIYVTSRFLWNISLSCVGRLSIISRVSVSKRRSAHMLEHTHSHTDIHVSSRCWGYFVSAKVVQPHVREGINHSPWTAVKTLLEAFVNPPRSFCSHMAIFTDAVWNDTCMQRTVGQE